METITGKTKRGRPETQIEWPQGEFTAEQVFSLNNSKVSRVSVHNKINRAVAAGEIVKTKKSANNIGRPSWMYTLSKSMNQQSDVSVEDF